MNKRLRIAFDVSPEYRSELKIVAALSRKTMTRLILEALAVQYPALKKVTKYELSKEKVSR